MLLALFPLNDLTVGVQDTVTIEPQETYELRYDNLNVSDKITWT